MSSELNVQPKGGLSSQVLDLLAYDGYKFVGYVSLGMLPQTSTDALSYSVIITLVAGLLGFGRTLYLLVFIYTFLSTAFFLVRLRSRPFLLTNSMLTLHTRLSFDHYALWCFPTRRPRPPP